MKTVTMLEFRRNAEAVLGRVAKGERVLLSHRGKPAARLEPVHPAETGEAGADLFLEIAGRAQPSSRGKTRHRDIDAILYGSG